MNAAQMIEGLIADVVSVPRMYGAGIAQPHNQGILVLVRTCPEAQSFSLAVSVLAQ